MAQIPAEDSDGNVCSNGLRRVGECVMLEGVKGRGEMIILALGVGFTICAAPKYALIRYGDSYSSNCIL